MGEVQIALEARKSNLLDLKKQIQGELEHAPVGKLRISGPKEKRQYYHRKTPDMKNGVYIRTSNFLLARALAQKEYYTQILQVIEEELEAIEKINGTYPKVCAEEVYQFQSNDRQKLIMPVYLSEEEYVHNWISQPYSGKSFLDNAPELYTAKGERVRSKSEIIIADALNRFGVPYKYECPITFDNGRTIYPDFTVLNVRERKEMHWEHFGMMDNPDYVEKTIHKKTSYVYNGMYEGEKLIFTYETSKIQLNQKVVNQMIQHYLL